MIPIIIANWKMNIRLSEAMNLAQKIESRDFSSDFLLALPTPYLAYFAKTLIKIKLCAQDVSAINGIGAYTGENSATLIKSCGVNYSIIGHSERRTMQKETNNIIQKKAENCIKAGITPIICIGEDQQTRQNKKFKEFLVEQVNYSVPDNANDFIIAYEPVWAIGSGMTPTPKEIYEVAELLKTSTKIDWVAQNVRLVYGGSVDSKNFAQIIKVDGISGVLIGSASLDEREIDAIL